MNPETPKKKIKPRGSIGSFTGSKPLTKLEIVEKYNLSLEDPSIRKALGIPKVVKENRKPNPSIPPPPEVESPPNYDHLVPLDDSSSEEILDLTIESQSASSSDDNERYEDNEIIFDVGHKRNSINAIKSPPFKKMKSFPKPIRYKASWKCPKCCRIGSKRTILRHLSGEIICSTLVDNPIFILNRDCDSDDTETADQLPENMVIRHPKAPIKSNNNDEFSSDSSDSIETFDYEKPIPSTSSISNISRSSYNSNVSTSSSSNLFIQDDMDDNASSIVNVVYSPSIQVNSTEKNLENYYSDTDSDSDSDAHSSFSDESNDNYEIPSSYNLDDISFHVDKNKWFSGNIEIPNQKLSSDAILAPLKYDNNDILNFYRNIDYNRRAKNQDKIISTFDNCPLWITKLIESFKCFYNSSLLRNVTKSSSRGSRSILAPSTLKAYCNSLVLFFQWQRAKIDDINSNESLEDSMDNSNEKINYKELFNEESFINFPNFMKHYSNIDN